ncbi:hypothetical protein WKT22_03535 [Candidatus Lokiarchaeum ossiferum]
MSLDSIFVKITESNCLKNREKLGKKEKKTALEAAVDNLWTHFLVFASSDPHTLEGLQRR